jgi:hypothetical protein
MTYLEKYLEKYPKEFQTAMSGGTIFGIDEMEDILKKALEQNKKFVLINNEDEDEISDGQSYKLV